MKEKLLSSETENERLSRQLSSTELRLREKEKTIIDQVERENMLRK